MARLHSWRSIWKEINRVWGCIFDRNPCIRLFSASYPLRNRFVSHAFESLEKFGHSTPFGVDFPLGVDFHLGVDFPLGIAFFFGICSRFPSFNHQGVSFP
jgi:hypothetical protein